MRKNVLKLFAKQFWQTTFKTKAIFPLVALWGLLVAYALFTGASTYTVQNEMRTHYQQEVREHWEDSPDKHPHRMAHYGYLAFRLKHPLSIFDFGMESYTGNAVFLEAHRQNTVNFSEASFSTGLLRFGEISVAMLLQILLPLIIFFLGFGSIATERDNGTLKILLSQGVSWSEIIVGKALGLMLVSMAFYLPTLLITGIVWAFLSGNTLEMTDILRFIGISVTYFAFFGVISFIATLISAMSQNAKSALVTLIGLWLLMAIVLPRTTQALGNYTHPSPSKIEFDAAIEQDIIKQGDSHNPDDPHYKALKDSLLLAYKVDSVQQLPFNYSGFVMTEGERLSAETYNKHLKSLLNTYENQNNWSKYTAFINPFIAIKNISMALSGTDFKAYIHFQDQAETFRYNLAQRMNGLQVKLMSNKKLGPKDPPFAISKRHWAEMPDFKYRFLSLNQVLKNEILSLLALGFWVVFLGFSPLTPKWIETI